MAATKVAKDREWSLALKRCMARRGNGDYRKSLDKMAEWVVSAAESGDTECWQEVANRLDGKHAQSLEISADVTSRNVTDLPDELLNGILAAPETSSEGTTDSPVSPQEPGSVH